MKSLTLDQIADRKEKAARFVENVLDDPERADEIRDESIESYAERRKFKILENPNGGFMQKLVANPGSKGDLMQEIRELRQQNDELQQQLNVVRGAPSGNPHPARTVNPADLLAQEVVELRKQKAGLESKLEEILTLASAPEGGAEESEEELLADFDAIVDIIEGEQPSGEE
jgi:hypothetical protein